MAAIELASSFARFSNWTSTSSLAASSTATVAVENRDASAAPSPVVAPLRAMTSRTCRTWELVFFSHGSRAAFSSRACAGVARGSSCSGIPACRAASRAARSSVE